MSLLLCFLLLVDLMIGDLVVGCELLCWICLYVFSCCECVWCVIGC